MKIPEIVYRQMPATRNLPKKSPSPGKIRMQKPQCKNAKVGGKFSVQIPRGARGDGYGKN